MIEINVQSVLDEIENDKNEAEKIDYYGEGNLQESVIGDIGKWFSNVKRSISKQTSEIGKAKAASQEFYKKWDRVYYDDKIHLYSKMNSKLPMFMTDININNIIQIIGMNIRGDIIKKNMGKLPVNEMRSLIIAGCIKHKVPYFKEMLNTQLYNGIFVGDDRNSKKINTPIKDKELFKMIQGKILGIKTIDYIDTDIFLYNAKVIPSIIKSNSQIIQKFQNDSKIVLMAVEKSIESNKDIPELPVFYDVFNHVVNIVVDMILEYNEAVLIMVEEMDKIYRVVGKGIHESVVGYAEMDTYIEPVEESFTKIEKADLDLTYFALPRLKKYPIITEKQLRAAINDFENVENEDDRKEMAKRIIERTIALKLQHKIHASSDNPIASYLPKWMVKHSNSDI